MIVCRFKKRVEIIIMKNKVFSKHVKGIHTELGQVRSHQPIRQNIILKGRVLSKYKTVLFSTLKGPFIYKGASKIQVPFKP